MVTLHIKLKGMTSATTCKHIFCPHTHPRPLGGVKGKNMFFSESSHIAYQINLNGAYSTMQAHICNKDERYKKEEVDTVKDTEWTKAIREKTRFP